MRDSEHFTPETPLRLAEAGAIRGLSAAALRREAQRGKLTIWRVAGKDWTSLAEIDRMFDLCRVPAKAPDCGFAPRPISPTDDCAKTPDGSSRTEAAQSALAAAQAKLAKLKIGSAAISRKNTRQRVKNVVYLTFPSPTS